MIITAVNSETSHIGVVKFLRCVYYEIYRDCQKMKVPGSSQVVDLSDKEYDELFKDAVELVVNYDRASASLLQRRLQVGYARAARIIDQLEAAGVVGPAEGANPREVLIKSPKELFGDDWEKLARKTDEIKVPEFRDIPKDPFGNIFFWLKVLKISLVVLIPYWLFGFQTGVLVGIILIALFLSKISLTLLELNEYPHEVEGTRKPNREGKITV
jgi:hypothetical protein